MTQTDGRPDGVNRIRVGLAIIVGVIVVAVVGLIASDDATVRLLMGAVVLIGFVQTLRLFRVIKRERSSGPG